MRNFLCPVFEYRYSVYCEGCRDRKYHTHPVFYFLKLTSWHSELGEEVVILDQNICQEYLETKLLEREICINMKSLREILLCVCVGLSSRVTPGTLSSQIAWSSTHKLSLRCMNSSPENSVVSIGKSKETVRAHLPYCALV